VIAAAAAGAAILPVSVLLGARASPGRPRNRHATDPVLGAVCASPAAAPGRRPPRPRQRPAGGSGITTTRAR